MCVCVCVCVYLCVCPHPNTCMRAKDALELIQRRGPSRLVVRQPGFTKQLLLLEQELLQARSTSILC